MIFFGGVLQILGAIGEWILGNTFPMCLFFTYGTFWIVAGTQLIPWFGVGVQYSTSGSNLEGMAEPGYYATVGTSSQSQPKKVPIALASFCQHNVLIRSSKIGFYYLALAMVTTIFCVCSLRTNIVFFSALFTLIFAFGSAAGAFWNIALGNADLGKKLTIVSLLLSKP